MQADPTIHFYAYISNVWTLLDDRVPHSGRLGGSNDPASHIADIGELTLTLNNSTGIYTPGGDNAPAGWKKKIPLKMEFSYDGETKIYPYRIEDIKINPRKDAQSVTVTALDWINDAITVPIVNPNLLEEVTADEAITDLISGMPIQPSSTSFDAGVTVFPTTYDTVRGNTKAYSELAKLSLSEVGQVYVKSTGELVFESNNYRNGHRELKQVSMKNGFLKKSDGGFILKSDGGKIVLHDTENVVMDNAAIDIDIVHGENIINYWKTNAYPKRVDTETLMLYTTEKAIRLASGERQTFKGNFTNPVGKSVINAIPPDQDPYIKSVLRFEGATENSGVVDDLGNIWTTNDIVLISYLKKTGERAGYFDGGGSWAETAHKADWELLANNFSISWWQYHVSHVSGAAVSSRDYSDSVPAWIIGNSDGTNSKCYFSSTGATFDIANGRTFGAITDFVWAFYEISRSGNNWYMFKDGVLTDSWTSSATIFASTAVMSIGRNGSTYLDAVVDDFQFVNGRAGHTSGYTPPTIAPQLEGTYGAMWTDELFTGTEITESLSITADYGTDGATYTVENTGAINGWYRLSTFGYGIYSDSPLTDVKDDPDSIAEFGYKEVSLNQAYQQDLYMAMLEGAKQVEYNKQPRTELMSISLIANKNPFMLKAFMKVDIGDLVHIKQDEQNIDSWYYVHGIEFQLIGKIIMFKWIVKRAFTLTLGLSLMACEFFGTGTTDAINYGYIPQVSGDTVTNRAWSAWVYADNTMSNGQYYVIGGQHSDDGGVRIQLEKSGGVTYLLFYNTRYNGVSQGVWYANTPITTGAWIHIFISQDCSVTPTTDPIFYVGGSLQAITEAITPAGTLDSEVGNPLVIGNIKTATKNYDQPLDGKVKDFRVYNMANTTNTPAILAPALFAEGAGGTGYLEGMVFQGLTVRTEDEANYTDLTLTTDTKVLDAYNGVVGTANGSPVMRAI